jgi:hypothetical protein
MKATVPHPIPPHMQQFHRANSFSEYEQASANGYTMTPPYGHQTNGTDYTDASAIHNQMVVRRAAQHPSYIPEQGNPGVATMGINPNVPIAQFPVAQHHLQRSMSYPPSITSSPGTYSTVSCRSPMPGQEVYYPQRIVPTSAYTSPIEQQQQQQQQPLIRYTHTPPMQQAPQQALIASTPMVAQAQQQFQHAQAEQNWYANAPNQGQMPVTTIPEGCAVGPAQAMGNNYWMKMDYHDVQHTLPST